MSVLAACGGALVSESVASTFAQLTTLRVGSTYDRVVEVDSEDAFIEAVSRVDEQLLPLLVLGGGSNIVASDTHFAGVVVRDRRSQIHVLDPAEGAGGLSAELKAGRVMVEVCAGTVWDEFVAWAVEQSYGGVELMSGIPGTVGASPVQNIGAYGAEVESVVHSVRMWDRVSRQIVVKNAADMQFSYRDSMVKRAARDGADLGHLQGPTGRWVILSVTFVLSTDGLSAPIRYGELAIRLGVEGGTRVPVQVARETVLRIRKSKGMVLDAVDHDTWSAGSFFMNPIISADQAAQLPPDAPRFPAGTAKGVPMVKTSAAWLISHAGFDKGFRVRPDAPASLSTKHSLALTNRGDAHSADIVELAATVAEGVFRAFGVRLHPEPVPVGFSWDQVLSREGSL